MVLATLRAHDCSETMAVRLSSILTIRVARLCGISHVGVHPMRARLTGQGAASAVGAAARAS